MKHPVRFALIVFLLACVPGPGLTEEPVIPDRTAAAAGFVDLLVKEDFGRAFGMFDAKMKSALPEAKLREVWTGLKAQAGVVQSRVRATSQKMGAYDIVLVTCRFEKGTLVVKVVFDAAGSVAGLFFHPPAPDPGPAPPAPAYVKVELPRPGGSSSAATGRPRRPGTSSSRC